MTKADNPHSVRLYDSIRKHADEETAEKITHKMPLSKSADIEKKFAWAESICADLESTFDEDTIREIRMECACGPTMGKRAKLKRIFQASSDLDDFVANVNKLNPGFTLEYAEDMLFLIYPCCYCPCVKRIDKPISKTWCYCTLGYTQKLFEHILDCKVDVALIESVKAGGDLCKIQIRSNL